MGSYPPKINLDTSKPLKALVSNLKYFVPAIIWALIILYLSSGPGIQLPVTLDISIDKIGHFGFYAIFAILIAYGFQKKDSTINKNSLFKSLIISSLYGISMEVMQYILFPNRYFEVLDIIANISGSFVGLLILYYKQKLWSK